MKILKYKKGNGNQQQIVKLIINCLNKKLKDFVLVSKFKKVTGKSWICFYSLLANAVNEIFVCEGKRK